MIQVEPTSQSPKRKCDMNIEESDRGINIRIKGYCDTKRPERFVDETFKVTFDE